MGPGTILLVHGTGVRLKDYQSSLSQARRVAAQTGVREEWVDCAWGDPIGVEFQGKSLPGPPSAQRLADEEADFAHWGWLFADPLFELEKLTIRGDGAGSEGEIPGRKPDWKVLWDEIAAYQPTTELRLLLERGALADLWPSTWSWIIQGSPIPPQAFEASRYELAEASHALARAVIAQLHVEAWRTGIVAPSRALRQRLLERLLADWGQQVLGIGDLFAQALKRLATSALRQHRERFSALAALPVGDILLYQAHGEQVRRFIREKIAAARPPVTVVAHSLGGIACVDLFALPGAPQVAGLVTVGSQSPFLYELGALYALQPPDPLPAGFPRWLNLYDRNDFLSYVAGPLWPEVEDHEIESGQPFPESHGAYLGNDEVWRLINEFMHAHD